MNKFLTLTLAGALLTASAGAGFASLLRNDFTALEGPVVAKKESTKELVIRNNTTGHEETLTADDSQLSSVKVGDTVLVLRPLDSKVIGTLVVTQPK